MRKLLVVTVLGLITAVGCTTTSDSGESVATSKSNSNEASAPAADANVVTTTGSELIETTTSAAAVENLFDSDFLVACDGVGVPLAAEYNAAPGAIHPVVVLAGKGTEMYARSSAVREAWTRTWTEAKPLGMAEIELVACAERSAETQMQICEGYESDGQPTDNFVELFEAVYEVSLHEARTGKEVATTTITARDEACPSFVMFTEGEPRVEQFSFDDPAIQEFLQPFVTP